MKALIQRVGCASVEVCGKTVGSCGNGFMILFCSVEGDTPGDVTKLAEKTASLRIFSDGDGKMNRSVLDVCGEILCISQFTLAADTAKGNRPSFIKAMRPDTAALYYEKYCEELLRLGVKKVDKGVFGADMQVKLVNDGPVTILLDTDNWKRKGGQNDC